MSLIPDDPITPYDFEALTETLEFPNEILKTSLDENRTVSHVTTENSDVEDAKSLLSDDSDVNARGENDCSTSYMLHEEPQQDYPEIVKMSMIYNADPSWEINENFTPLQIACFGLNVAVVKLLIDRGVKVNEKFANGSTILHYISGDINKHFNLKKVSNYEIARKIKQEIAEVLLDHGANVYYRDKNGRTPIFYAVEASDAKITKMLISRGALINITDNKRMTPLHFTTTRRFSFEEEFLLTDQTCYDMAILQKKYEYRQRYQAETFKLLLKSGADFSVKQAKMRKPSEKVLRTFMRFGLRSLEQPTKTTELHVAVRNNNIKLVENLIKSGFDIDTQDSFGNTALHCACQMVRSEIVSMLLAYGADFRVLNKQFNTPFRVAIQGRCGRSILNDINRYMTKLILVKLDPGQQNKGLKIGVSREVFEDYSPKCNRELEKMKSIVIGDTGINYFELLVSNNENLMKYLKNERVVQILEARKFKIFFPEFTGVISFRFNQGISRIKLIDALWDNDLFKSIFSKIPVRCVEKIVTFLENEDLKTFT